LRKRRVTESRNLLHDWLRKKLILWRMLQSTRVRPQCLLRRAPLQQQVPELDVYQKGGRIQFQGLPKDLSCSNQLSVV
jgi:hypothetical protein